MSNNSDLEKAKRLLGEALREMDEPAWNRRLLRQMVADALSLLEKVGEPPAELDWSKQTHYEQRHDRMLADTEEPFFNDPPWSDEEIVNMRLTRIEDALKLPHDPNLPAWDCEEPGEPAYPGEECKWAEPPAEECKHNRTEYWIGDERRGYPEGIYCQDCSVLIRKGTAEEPECHYHEGPHIYAHIAHPKVLVCKCGAVKHPGPIDEPCQHETTNIKTVPSQANPGDWEKAFICKDCGERVG